MLVFLCSCNSSIEIKYYSQNENYISVTGTVSNIKYNEDSTVLIDDKLKTGEQITFITAPKYFGDGYVMPIVAISVNGENLLDFEEGYEIY